jgi:hypothetical protein
MVAELKHVLIGAPFQKQYTVDMQTTAIISIIFENFAKFVLIFVISYRKRK